MKIETVYIGAAFTAISLLAICVQCPNMKNFSMELLGNQCGFYIYILHLIMMHLFDHIVDYSSVGIIMWMRLIIVSLLTIIAFALVWRVMEMIWSVKQEH